MRIRPRSPLLKGYPSPRRQPDLKTLAAQFAPQCNQAERSGIRAGKVSNLRPARQRVRFEA